MLQRDFMKLGLMGGIAGLVIGGAGVAAASYYMIRNTNGPRERAFRIRSCVLCWLGVATFLVVLFLLPQARP
jgi:hypothetical protein